MKKIGLVLAGGGGKGAYQIGVWRVLREFGLEKSIKAISGTSVGALNGALFLQNDYRAAEKVWLTMSPEKILSLRSAQLLESLQKIGMNISDTKIYKYANVLQGYGIFTRHGLIKLIKEAVDLNSVTSSSIPFYVTCCQLGSQEPKYIRLNGLTPDEIEKYLLATSAIPGVFPPEEIDGKLYYDGGLPLVGDNNPIQPVYKEGCDLILVVLLDRSSLINKEQYPKANIIEILPQDAQGNLFNGTLQFTAVGAKRRIEQGYQDTKALLEPFLRSLSFEYKFIQTTERIQRDHNEFERLHKEYNGRLHNQMMDFERKLRREGTD
ncbi:patatin-like phospholipase family protein [Paenibacillus hamazuiensis]|uniref:patatin-like phospholipase family protein n=1 Tax=Paenibacillus hamazuiensis TaxID=2936508 RepID=UPI00200D640C|nr:patatin-like phospholipase family protein [Paenibacillus hamazuiensis]